MALKASEALTLPNAIFLMFPDVLQAHLAGQDHTPS